MLKTYFDENDLDSRQPYYALIVLVLIIAYGLFTSTQAVELPVFLIAGLAIGYVFTRSRFGFAGGIKSLFYGGNSQLAVSLLILLGVTAFLTTGIQWQAASQGAVSAYLASAKQAIIPGSASVELTNIGTIIGGAIFGSGMLLAGGCASGTLTDFGEGEGHAIITLPFFIIGSPLGLWLSGKLDASAIGKIGGEYYLPTYFGYIGSFIFLLVFLGILYLVIRAYQKHRQQAGLAINQTTYAEFEKSLETSNTQVNLYHRLFIQRWSFTTAALLTSIIAAFIIITTGKSWGVTSAFTLQGTQLLHALGFSLNDPVFAAINLKIQQGGFLVDGSSVRNLGIVLGSLVAFLLAGRFHFKFNFHLKDSATYALGGLFMGVGARLAKGCNIGALYSGITNYSVHGYIFLIFLVIGSVITLSILEGKLVLFPKRHTRQQVDLKTAKA
ncbi:YeeE/YedE family protein [Enterococcus dongliensis]|uniref:YeeE/YedE family protein n=1 Tax=Enterococcus dongliensis TaxID=2559925 RepID=UPI00288DBFE7|nr:YeeE/YedE family protein [Enterococcus dongliensis]MDT2604305.1 YeeE/YedE family protein [Enterococcus dongliensis]MDT2645501.1 YeeE/YedE family protein [Enterococcus dongliensis]MDT2672204.1 YeeE/YedE family protein [Enterococcus dongliensis]